MVQPFTPVSLRQAIWGYRPQTVSSSCRIDVISSFEYGDAVVSPQTCKSVNIIIFNLSPMTLCYFSLAKLADSDPNINQFNLGRISED